MLKRMLAVLALLAMVVGLVPALPLAAQGPVPLRAAPLPKSAAPLVSAPQWGGTWQNGPTTPFQLVRFDAGYYPGDGQVYFMGGRNAAGQVPGNIWAFDPVAGTYNDTGAAMVTPIQYYTMNLLQDSIGWGFYTVCGLLAGSPPNPTPVVQVYYPDANLALQLGPEDDYPGTVNCMAAGNVVYDNKLYVFGGYDGMNMTDETWVFDPTAPAGSRWTQISTATLNRARSHIMGALVDGKIYAVGGSYIDGANMVSVADVEVMDPTAPAPIWDDASAADLPEVCSQGRAWGFDSGTPYSDPDGTSLDGKVVSTCGVWTVPNNHVYVYDVAANSWASFPSLSNARRLNAAELVGAEAPGPDGVPGLWVWGGYDPTGQNPVNTSEYYTLNVALPGCNILLVDDDWDRSSTHGGGRPYYTSTLEYLGRPYDLWDTVSQGTPSAAYMDSYDAVIWFTGYDWETPISPTEEAELVGYLDGGGNLLVSDQEQNYAFGITPLLSDYFWVNSIVDDATITDTVGNAADPLFAGLGPYTMARPDLWDTYWPTETQYVGPYDDEVHVKPGGYEPMNYFTGGAPNSTRFEGAGFKTIYLAWPFEWLPNVEDRAAVLGTSLDWFCGSGPVAGMELLPPAQAQTGVSGASIPYTLTLANNLGFDDSFTLTYSSAWAITGPGTVGPVSNGGTQSFIVTVTIPAEANCAEIDMASALAQSQSVPAYSDQAFMQTTVGPNGMGTVDATILDANTGLALENAYIEFYLGNYYFYDWTGPDGFVSFADVPACPRYDGTTNMLGYFNHPFTLTVLSGQPTTLTVSLDAGVPELSAESVDVRVEPSATLVVPLTLTNNGTGDLRFYISELASDTIFEPPLVGMPQGVDSQVYADLAASTDGTAMFVIYMAQQADLSAAFGIRDWNARGRYVLDTLRQTAQRGQADLLNDLADAGVSYESRYIVNAVVVEGNRSLVDRIAARPDVAFIGPDTAIPTPAPVASRPAPDGADAVEWNIQKVRADDAWADFGATGQGIVVANIDTGVMYTHTALVNQYRGNLGGTFDHNYSWWDPYGGSPNYPYDSSSHGSHTMGTMVGDDGVDNQIGMAPGAQWIACDGFDDATGYGYNAELLECAEFILAPWDLAGANPNPAMRPDVVNNSWGGGQAQWWYNQAVHAWRAAGIFPVFSNGNDGPDCETVGDPADMISSFAVGATDANDSNAPGTWAEFSSRGPAAISGLVKPNVSAPGAGIRSAYNDGGYGMMDGTSMAAPHVAGDIALIWSAVPELRGDVQLTSWLVEQSATRLAVNQGYYCGNDGPASIPNNQYGWGRIDAYQAISMALSSAWDIAWLSPAPAGGTVASGEASAIGLTFDSNGLELGCYTGTLKVEFNDPYVGEVFVPVQMCVAPCEPVTEPTFGWTPVTPTVGTAVQFNGAASGTLPIAFDWDFGDGTLGTGSNPTHTYSSADAYTVTMMATNCDGDWVAVSHQVTVTCEDITAVMTWMPDTPLVGEQVVLTATATGGTPPITYSWDLGDGTTAVGITVTHAYTASGSYTVTLTVSDGCSTAAIEDVVVVTPATWSVYLPVVYK